MEIRKRTVIEIRREDILGLLLDSRQIDYNLSNVKIRSISVNLAGQYDPEFESMTVEVEEK